MAAIFTRPELARRMAAQLIDPGPLDEGLRSGLFLSGLRRTGKTTFLKHDLIPALEESGAVVVYTDLWSDVSIDPAELVRSAIQQVLLDIQTPGSRVAQRLSALRGLSVKALGAGFSFDLAKIGTPAGVTVAEALTELVDKTGTNVVLIVDEVQHALTSTAGSDMLLALKAARDAVNTRPATPGHVLVVGTGSHRAYVAELTSRRSQAFAGAASVPYPVLDKSYLDHLHARLVADGVERVPSLAALQESFERLGHRPEELLKALRLQTQQAESAQHPDDVIRIVSRTLRTGMADIELGKIERLGPLAGEVFRRIAESDGEARGLYSRATLADLACRLGRQVAVIDVQRVLDDLTAENVVMRGGHGRFSVTDPFVQAVWAERQAPASDALTAPSVDS